jgi:VWA domain-containing protein
MTFIGMPIWGVALVIAASAGALGLLHLLRIRPRPVRVITTLFWAQVAEHARARSLLQRFRHPLTYLLLLLICVLIALALGQPERESVPADRLVRVFVIDAGAASGAQDETGRTRLERAAERVRRRVASYAATDRIAVIVADPWPRTLSRFDDPRPVVARRLSELRPANVPAAIGRAISLAQALLRGRANAEVELLSTSGAHAASPATEFDAPVRVLRVGRPASNAAVISAIFEPQADNPLRGTFRVRVGAWGGDQTIGVRIQRDGGGLLLEDSRKVSSGGTADFAIASLDANGDLLQIDLQEQDAVEVDNHWTFRLPLRGAIRVRPAGQDAEALTALLRAAPELVLAPEGAADVDVLSAEGPVETPGAAIVLVDGPDHILPGLAVRPFGKSPLVNGLVLDAARTAAGPGIHAGQPLLACEGGVLAAITQDPERRQLLLSRALLREGATATRQPGFAVFLARVIRHLAGWGADTVVLPPVRAMEDPLWAAQRAEGGEASVAPADRSTADVSIESDDAVEVEPKRRALGRPFEMLLMLAALLALAEALLHLRGRIP